MNYGNSLIIKNTFEKGFNTLLTDNILFHGNRLYGDCSFSGAEVSFVNNFVYDTLFFSGVDQKIYHNNFDYDSYLILSLATGNIMNNNICNMSVSYPLLCNITRNNYIMGKDAFVNYYGNSPFYYDPMYGNNDDLHSKNMALIKKGAVVNDDNVLFDFDSVERRYYPGIGANKICFNPDQDTVYLRCDDYVNLGYCDDFEDLYWSGDEVEMDSLNNNPTIYFDTSAHVYLNSNINGVIDTVYLTRLNAAPFANASFDIDDNLWVEFQNLSECYDSLSWYFGDGHTSSEENPSHQYSYEGTFYCSLSAYNNYGEDHYIFGFYIEDTEVFNLNASSINVYPNPFKEELFIKTGTREISEIKVFDLYGKLIYMDNHFDNPDIIEMNLQDLKIGMYIMQLKNHHINHSYKIFKR